MYFPKKSAKTILLRTVERITNMQIEFNYNTVQSEVVHGKWGDGAV